MLEMSDHQRLTGIKAAAEACVLAKRPDLIVQAIDQAWWNGRAAATTWLAERVASERTESERVARERTESEPASAASAHRGASSATTDVLAEVIRKRFDAQNRGRQ